MAGPEHTLQTAVIKMAAAVIDAPHRIRASDRSKNIGGMQHLAEASRGIRKGTPDTELIVGGRSINIELKAPGTRHLKSHQPSEAQEIEMQNLRAAGAYAACAWSCVEVVHHWRKAGVPLRPSADLVALDADLRVETRIARAAAAPKKARQGMAVRPTPAALRRVAAMRSKRMF